MTPQQFRALYRQRKRVTRLQRKGHLTNITKADARARGYIERWLAGETHQQIADSEGVAQSSVTKAIAAYRKRHPDTPIPVGAQKKEMGAGT